MAEIRVEFYQWYYIGTSACLGLNTLRRSLKKDEEKIEYKEDHYHPYILAAVVDCIGESIARLSFTFVTRTAACPARLYCELLFPQGKVKQWLVGRNKGQTTASHHCRSGKISGGAFAS